MSHQESRNELKNILRNIGLFTALLSTLLASGCNTEGAAEGLVPDTQQSIHPDEMWWNIPIPDLSQSQEKPQITLNGNNVIILQRGEDYTELGAQGFDEVDGDISTQININHSIDINTSGDYIVRYTLTDSDSNDAVEVNRLVRVYQDKPTPLTQRPVLTTQSNFGYIEHLPNDYGIDPDKKYPLIIFNHGNGVNASPRSTTDPEAALAAVVDNGGPITMIKNNKWDENLPFIVLTPHFGFVDGIDNVFRFNAFVDYALHTYNVDKDKVYMTGWSQGGLASYDYAVKHPEKIAAIISVSGGYPYGSQVPNYLCGIETIPMWLFHGNNDEVVAHGTSTAGYHRIIENCQPTVLPKLSLIDGAGHELHNSIFDLSGMAGGAQGYVFDTRYDEYDQNIYDWLLSHSK